MMADTHIFKTRIEPFVQEWLESRCGQKFRREYLPLEGCTGFHEFDAVSADRTIVAGIKSSSGETSGGKNPSGKLASVYQELYFLSNVKADTKLLILTDVEFYHLVVKKITQHLAGGIRVEHCPLSPELQELARKVHADASDEIDRGKQRARGRGAAG
jgi:hypothetical protein